MKFLNNGNGNLDQFGFVATKSYRFVYSHYIINSVLCKGLFYI